MSNIIQNLKKDNHHKFLTTQSGNMTAYAHIPVVANGEKKTTTI